MNNPFEKSFAMYQPTVKQVKKLIETSSNHRLGLEFLLNGDLAAVSATFGVHAFTVEAARRYWSEISSKTEREEKHGL